MRCYSQIRKPDADFLLAKMQYLSKYSPYAFAALQNQIKESTVRFSKLRFLVFEFGKEFDVWPALTWVLALIPRQKNEGERTDVIDLVASLLPSSAFATL